MAVCRRISNADHVSNIVFLFTRSQSVKQPGMPFSLSTSLSLYSSCCSCDPDTIKRTKTINKRERERLAEICLYANMKMFAPESQSLDSRKFLHFHLFLFLFVSVVVVGWLLLPKKRCSAFQAALAVNLFVIHIRKHIHPASTFIWFASAYLAFPIPFSHFLLTLNGIPKDHDRILRLGAFSFYHFISDISGITYTLLGVFIE